ncbi:MAG: hypothetical protein ACI3T9_04995 [Romboutsia timonensis]
MSELYNISDAFKELDLLNEDIFKADDAGIDKLKSFMDGDQEIDSITVIDPEAESVEDLKDSYIGKIILNCEVCQSKFYKDKEDIVIDEETQLVNVGEECPYCTSMDGFEIVGQVAEYCPDCDDEEDKNHDAADVEVDTEFEVEETEEVEDDLIEDLGADIAKYQKWVDYDMKRFGKLSKKTKADLDKAGLTIVKDKYGEYQVIGREVDGKALKEAVDLTKINGTIANLLKDNMSRLSNIQDVNKLRAEVIDLVDSSGIADKKAVADFKSRVEKAKNTIALLNTIATYMTGMRTHLEGLQESVESVEVKTEDNIVRVNTEGEGTQVDIQPRQDVEEEVAMESEEVITPVDDEVKMEIEAQSDEEESEEDFNDYEDVDFDEFDEESFDELGEQYLRKVYENVKSYKTVKGTLNENNLKLEGVITFNSGKQVKTNFLFEGATILKNGSLKLIGENKNFSDKKNAFGLRGRVTNKKLMVESFNYNYVGKDATTGKSKRLYGTIRKSN